MGWIKNVERKMQPLPSSNRKTRVCCCTEIAMKAIRLICPSCLLVATLCCNSLSQNHGTQTPSLTSIQDNVRECVFRYQIANFGISDRDYSKHFFVGNGFEAKDDPSPEIVSNLQSSTYSVKGISQCKSSTGGVIDAKTKERGLLFVVTKIKSISAKQFQVNARFFKSGKSGNAALYTVNSLNGRWKVVKCKILALY